jgi:hypothetical protein
MLGRSNKEYKRGQTPRSKTPRSKWGQTLRDP